MVKSEKVADNNEKKKGMVAKKAKVPAKPCGCSDPHKRKPTIYPPKKAKHLPPILRTGELLTIPSGTDRYGYVVDKVLEDGWTVRALLTGIDCKIPQWIRWNHQKGYWMLRCCLDNYSCRFIRYGSNSPSAMFVGKAVDYLDPHF